MPLIVNNVSKSFDGLAALDGVSLSLIEGKVSAIVGGNGAGKSTLFNIIGGYLQPDGGEVLLSGGAVNGSSIKLTGLPPHSVSLNGVGMLFQSVRVFERLTTLENVLTGFSEQAGEGIFSALFGKGVAAREKENTERAMFLLEFVGLAGKESQAAGSLSFGQQKLLAIARILAAKARVLLLDEPTSGVHPEMVESLLLLIDSLASKEARIIALIEHNEDVVRQLADTTFAIEQGRLIGFDHIQTKIKVPTERLAILA